MQPATPKRRHDELDRHSDRWTTIFLRSLFVLYLMGASTVATYFAGKYTLFELFAWLTLASMLFLIYSIWRLNDVIHEEMRLEQPPRESESQTA